MKLGIIGGGQLAQMISEVAKSKNYHVTILDPIKNCPASFVADEIITGSLTDIKDIEKLCSSVDIVTYEFENIPFEIIQELEKKYNIPQGYKPLMLSQNRITEKEYAKKCNVNIGKFKQINTYTELQKEIIDFNYNAVIKTIKNGYDGKGQIVIKNKNDLFESKKLLENNICILEEFVDYDFEISICIARNEKEEYIFPIPNKNVHKNNILYKVDGSKYFKSNITDKACDYALTMMRKENLIGIIVFEFFVKGKEVFFNEMAPRPHNSYHYGLDASNICQFGGLIKAITNQKIKPDKEIVKSSVMFNILGEELNDIIEYFKSLNIDINNETFINKFNKKNPKVKIRLYGKEKSIIGRKMGHLTFVNDNIEELLIDVNKFESR